MAGDDGHPEKSAEYYRREGDKANTGRWSKGKPNGKLGNGDGEIKTQYIRQVEREKEMSPDELHPCRKLPQGCPFAKQARINQLKMTTRGQWQPTTKTIHECPLKNVDASYCALCLLGNHHEKCYGKKGPCHPCKRVFGSCRYEKTGCVFSVCPARWCLYCLTGKTHLYCEGVTPLKIPLVPQNIQARISDHARELRFLPKNGENPLPRRRSQNNSNSTSASSTPATTPATDPATPPEEVVSPLAAALGTDQGAPTSALSQELNKLTAASAREQKARSSSLDLSCTPQPASANEASLLEKTRLINSANLSNMGCSTILGTLGGRPSLSSLSSNYEDPVVGYGGQGTQPIPIPGSGGTIPLTSSAPPTNLEGLLSCNNLWGSTPPPQSWQPPPLSNDTPLAMDGNGQLNQPLASSAPLFSTFNHLIGGSALTNDAGSQPPTPPLSVSSLEQVLGSLGETVSPPLGSVPVPVGSLGGLSGLGTSPGLGTSLGTSPGVPPQQPPPVPSPHLHPAPAPHRVVSELDLEGAFHKISKDIGMDS